MGLRDKLKVFLIPKFRFAVTSAVATLVDYGLYILLTILAHLSDSASHAISYSVGMIVNFLLQKTYIFQNNRKVGHAFLYSVVFSLIGWLLSQALFNFLIYYTGFFKNYDLLAKVVVTATIFFYNFYSKRFSFEKKMPWKS